MPPKSSQNDRKLNIRKYPNRRYYDATRSRHVTLEAILALIRDGYDIQVTDSSTGQDITGKVLAQIIIELDPPKLDVFPAPLLHKLLRSSESLVTDFVQKYFNQALDSFLDSQRSMEQVVRSAMGLPPSTPTLSDWTKMMWSPLRNAPWSPGEGPAQPSGGAPSAAATDTAGEQDLRAQVARLQDEIGKLRNDAKRPRRKPRKSKH